MIHVIQEQIEHPAGPLVTRFVTVIDGPDTVNFPALRATFERQFNLTQGETPYPGTPARYALHGHLTRAVAALRAQGASPRSDRVADVFAAWLTLQPGFTAVAHVPAQLTIDEYDDRGL